MRMTDKDWQDAIYRPHSNEQLESLNNPNEEVEVENKFYTILGRQEFIDGDGYPRATEDDVINHLAKMQVVNNRLPRYFVKLSAHGTLVNPISPMNQMSYSIKKEEYTNGKYVEVNKRVFKFYIDFLKTKNNAYLINAEREMTG